jgi:hypothetical protein
MPMQVSEGGGRGMPEVWLQPIRNFCARRECAVSTIRPPFYPGEKPGTQPTGGGVGLAAGLVRQVSPHGVRSHNHPARSESLKDYDIPAAYGNKHAVINSYWKIQRKHTHRSEGIEIVLCFISVHLLAYLKSTKIPCCSFLLHGLLVLRPEG